MKATSATSATSAPRTVPAWHHTPAARMASRFAVGSRQLGEGAPCFVIAEAGSNHNGSLARARELVEVAAEAGADAVKFQTFQAAKLYPKSAGTSDYLGDPTPIYDIIQKMEMPPEWLAELAALARSLGLAFISSPFHEAAVELLDPYVDAFKIASYELTHAPLLRAVAGRDKPVLLSTGASNLAEVARAVVTLRDAGCDRLALMQCTASYPTPPHAVHARALVTLRDRFDIPTGLSDHSRDPVVAPTVAVALGATLIEKHFTLSNDLPGPDHRFAVEPAELRALCAAVRAAETVLGDARRDPDAVEAELRSFARRSVFALRPIAAGQRVERDDVEVLRHGKNEGGLPPEALDRVVGARARRDLPSDRALQAEDLAFDAAPALSLRRADRLDAALLHAWANEPAARAASWGRAEIPWPTHLAWLERSLAAEDRALFVASEAGVPIATLRVDQADVASYGPATGVVSINLDPSVRGRGLSPLLLGLLDGEARTLGLRRLIAWIAPENAASVRAFARAGYVEDGNHDVDGHPALRRVRRLDD